jgi:ABC-type lipoprotein release transport system permease subunit
MNVILKISLRNLVRQKRRNLLLGMGIAFGMCILVMANALGAGISDLLLNKMGGRVFGHVFVSMSEKDEKKWDIIRDKNRIEQVILDNVDGVKAIHEHIAIHGKALGNGKTIYITILGVEPDEEFYRETAVVSGNLADLDNPTIEYPVALYERMAERLNVQVNDVIRMRFESVYGQVQTAQFTVVAIMKAFNPFLNMLSYAHFKHLKPLMGYQAYETDSFNIVLEHVTDPQQAIEQANQLHNALQPGVAGYQGVVH